jgi:hypothetical protein
LTIEEIDESNEMMIILKKAPTLYKEVGIYETKLSAKLIDYPAVTKDYDIIVHVFFPCKNVIEGPMFGKSNTYGWSHIGSTFYAGVPLSLAYRYDGSFRYIGGIPFVN